MATTLTWLGHAAWSIRTANATILLDPFLEGNPSASTRHDQLQADYILVSHGHADHVGDTGAIARRTGAQVIASYEICAWLERHEKVPHTIGHNLGGGSNHSFGRVQLTLAHHSSALPDGSYGGNPCGFLLTLAEGKIYFACDTGLFYDMKLIGDVGIDLAVLPIGDLFTMGPDDSLRAIELIRPKCVIPSHYNTWPPIAQDASQWAASVSRGTSARPVVLKPGETYTLGS